ncbi:uncharacterized protein LOC115624003 [Scaptodrosophila lebanonensis]|uniref:Uncharacterized protein LOC115624003 n=1 Tax=Drosophila lebanonensis TaxID=7225 RepID=A0A6J2TH59_DROLE|nr:uncharacterized protein LOC115624003 [Scaptodrosophila lebanonensis]
MAAAAHICVSCSSARRRHSQRNTVAGSGRGSASGRDGGAGGGNATLSIYSAWALLTLLAASTAMVQSAAVSFGDFLSHPTFKPLCSAQHEHFIESEGKESSLIIELKPGAYGAQHKSCSRILSAPAQYGFIVRLILPKLRHHQSHTQSQIPSSAGSGESSISSNIMPAGITTKPRQGSSGASALSEMTTLIERLNATTTTTTSSASSLKTIQGRTCPLNIFSSLDPHTPQWRVDPCQLEDTAPEMEDPVRLFHGRVRIVWEHGQHSLKSKLMITVLGKGEQCKHESKHQCLRIGDEPILCISKELACDGIRHCPYSNEYDSDEDYDLCFKHRRPGVLPTALDSDLFEQFALEVFRNLFAYDAPTAPEDLPRNGSAAPDSTSSSGGSNNTTTTLRKVHTKDMKKPSDGNGSPNAIGEQGEGPKQDNATLHANEGGSGFTRRNSTRSGLHSDLSKYGPWGYLMLGMLLCGGALLICGLWASASQHAVNNEREAALAAANGVGIDQPSVASPPNYEELDPPPAYSVLFPNQKAASSNTLNALDNTSALSTSLSASGAATTTTAAAAAVAAVVAAEQALQQQQQQQPQQPAQQ